MPIRPLIVSDNFTIHKNYTPSEAPGLRTPSINSKVIY